MSQKVILHGGGGHAKVVIDALLSGGVAVDAVFDPKYESGHILNIPFKGAYNPDYQPEAKALIAIGDNARRQAVAAVTIHDYYTLIHQSSTVSSFAKVGRGCMILHGSIVQAHANIGAHVIVNTGAIVEHDCVVGDFAHIAPKANLCGNVRIGEGTLVGAGAVVIPGISVGRWAVIGAGAVVTKDIPDFAVAVGNPARIVKYQNAEVRH